MIRKMEANLSRFGTSGGIAFSFDEGDALCKILSGGF
jgi:hypothetical protein